MLILGEAAGPGIASGGGAGQPGLFRFQACISDSESPAPPCAQSGNDDSPAVFSPGFCFRT